MAKVHLHRTYRWVDKDPIIDACRSVVAETKLTYNRAHEISGIATATLTNWFEGDTRRPQNSTVTALTSALGFVRRDTLNRDGSVNVGFIKARDLDWQKEMEKQADFMLQHGTAKQKAALKKKRKGNGA